MPNSVLHLYTDASGSLGYGAVFGSMWFHGPWPAHWVGHNITLLELYPIVAALHVWGPLLRDSRLMLHTDNMALVHILNAQTSKDATIMILVRKLVVACMMNNVHVRQGPLLPAREHPARALVPQLMDLLAHSMVKSSWALYERAYQSLEDFRTKFGLPLVMPVPPAILALYVSYLFNNRYASSTIVTYLSAIGYIHNIQGLPDATANFLVQKVLQGVKKSRPTADVRLPITLSALTKIIQAANFCVESFYQRTMFISMLTLAFSAFLRVGEMSVSHGNTCNVLKLPDVQLLEHSTAVCVLFTNYKHSAGRTARILSRDSQTAQALRNYLSIRGNTPGYLYIWPSGKPITRIEFTKMFQSCLHFCNLDTSVYKSHSLRIGAACQAASMGYTGTQIRQMGRWHSDAFLKYIRLV